MKRILLLATMALVMAAMILAMAVPVFAQPAFQIVCFSENTGEGLVVFTDQGRVFGEGNRTAASLGFHGQECQREVTH